MSRCVYTFSTEPRGELLSQLFNFLGGRTTTILMVLRNDLDLDPGGQQLLAMLEPFLLERKRSSSWPGTTLLNDQATVLRFGINDSVLEALRNASDGLFGWQQPKLPEDLAFVRDDGTEMLGSICHEHDAYLDLSREEYQELLLSVGEVGGILGVPGDGDQSASSSPS